MIFIFVIGGAEVRANQVRGFIISVRRSAGIFALIFVCGCASTGGKGDPELVTDEDGRFVILDQEAYETRLRNEIESDLRREHRRQGETSADLEFSRPFYYKEYYTYPGEPEVYTLEFTEKESRTTPLVAELEVEKVRYSTRMHQKRDQARADETFLRSRGVERASYELRNGQWRRIGSLFLADSRERYVNGEWQPVEETRSPAMADDEQEPKGFWQRLLFWR